jgi:HD-like signal output (HDOD) protein
MPEVSTDTTVADRIRLEALLRAIDELPTIPETLVKILRILDDPQSSAQALADVVRLDVPLTSKILRLANSPYYCAGGNIGDVKSCIAVLGFKTVRQVAICVSIASSLVAECNRRRARLDYRDLWQHSVHTGVIAKELSRLVGDADPEEVFTAGLLHDLGKFVILLHAPATYDQVIVRRRECGRRLVDVELDLLGFDHAMAGEAFGVSWRFPLALTRPARLHHDRLEPGAAADRGERMAALVALADYLANVEVPAGSDLGFDRSQVCGEALRTVVGLTEADVAERMPRIREAVGNCDAYLDLA